MIVVIGFANHKAIKDHFVGHSTKDFNGFSHGGFDIQSSNVLPSLLHQGDQEVDGHGQVLSDLFLSLISLGNSSTQARGLL